MRSVYFFITVLFFALSAHADILSELNPQQQKAVFAGQQVYMTNDVPGKPWPKMRYYQLVKATAEETMAVGFDFESKPPYTPGLKTSKILRFETPTTPVVEYVMEIPIFSDEHVVHRFQLSTYGQNNDSYLLTWKLIKGSRTKLSEGNMRVEPLKDGAVVAFQGFVDPGIPFAGMFKGTALEQTLKQGDGFLKQVEKEHDEQDSVLQTEIQTLRKALGQQ